MLSYPVDEAEDLLTSKLSTAQTSLSNCEEDLDFLREQITVRVSNDFGSTWSLELTVLSRPWKSQQRGSTIGRSYKNERIRQAKKLKRTSHNKKKVKAGSIAEYEALH